jgi:hypothetical protein
LDILQLVIPPPWLFLSLGGTEIASGSASGTSRLLGKCGGILNQEITSRQPLVPLAAYQKLKLYVAATIRGTGRGQSDVADSRVASDRRRSDGPYKVALGSPRRNNSAFDNSCFKNLIILIPRLLEFAIPDSRIGPRVRLNMRFSDGLHPLVANGNSSTISFSPSKSFRSWTRSSFNCELVELLPPIRIATGVRLNYCMRH